MSYFTHSLKITDGSESLGRGGRRPGKAYYFLF
jgi:hypothetical protein